MNKNYYAFIAHNCVAVFDSWAKVEMSKKYATRPHFKKFGTFYEAEAYALEGYSMHYPVGYPAIEELECNQMIFTKNQRPQNLMRAINNASYAPAVALADKNGSKPICADNEASRENSGSTKRDPNKYYIDINMGGDDDE